MPYYLKVDGTVEYVSFANILITGDYFITAKFIPQQANPNADGIFLGRDSNTWLGVYGGGLRLSTPEGFQPIIPLPTSNIEYTVNVNRVGTLTTLECVGVGSVTFTTSADLEFNLIGRYRPESTFAFVGKIGEINLNNQAIYDPTASAQAGGTALLDTVGSNNGTLNNFPSNPFVFYSSGGTTLSPQGISSDEAFGSPSIVLGSVTLGVTAIPSEEVFGSPSLLAGSSFVQPSAIPTGEELGSPNIDVGGVLIEPVSIVSEELFGTPDVVSGLTAIAPTGIISAEAFGACLVKNLVSLISLSGIPTQEVFGSVTVLGGDRIIIPINDRQTWNRVANYLRGRSFKGSDNDVIIQWLRSEGYEGQYNDSLNSYLEITECYKGTLTDKYAKWKRGETPTGCWLLEGGIWNDNGSWIDTEFWED